MKNLLKKIKWNDIKDYIFIIIAVVLVRTFLITPALVNGASMDNTLKDGQLVIINKIVYKVSDINRFDIVVVKNNEDNDTIIKRVIGLPNEKIEYKNNKLYINGVLQITNFNAKDTKDFEVTTKDDEYFVMGDNRPVSKDSRILGNFKKNDIIGRVKLRLFPFSKFGIVEK